MLVRTALAVWLVLGALSPISAQTLRIYHIDVDQGAATLFVGGFAISPANQAKVRRLAAAITDLANAERREPIR